MLISMSFSPSQEYPASETDIVAILFLQNWNHFSIEEIYEYLVLLCQSLRVKTFCLIFVLIGKVHIGTCMKHDAKPYLSQVADLVVVVVLKHTTPGLHHGTLQTTRQCIGGKEASSGLV